MDIEGAEFDIIENLSQETFDRIDSFMIEYHDFYFDEGMQKVHNLIGQLEAAGFTVNSPIGKVGVAEMKIIYASKVKKSYWVDMGNSISIRNLYDFSRTFTWDNMNNGSQDGYNHLINEMHFIHDGYTNGNVYERFGCIVQKGDIVVDCGANIGAFANYAYHKGASEIYAIEPIDISFNCLMLNKPAGSTVIKAAVGNRIGLAKINLPSQHDTMSASMLTTGGIINTVPLITIDSLFDDRVLDRIDFLKIDCEGAEKEILEGISDENLGKIKKIALEFHKNYLTEDDSNRMITRLVEKGFQSFQLFLGNGDLRIYNFWKA
jgi:FkbM family methyltransferase